MLGLRGLILHVACVQDFKTTVCHSLQLRMDSFSLDWWFYYMCKILQEAIQVQREWSPRQLDMMLHQSVCVCVFEKAVLLKECARACVLIMSKLFIRMLLGRIIIQTFSRLRCAASSPSKYCSLGSNWVYFLGLKRHTRPKTSASADRLKLARLQEQTEETLSHKNKNTLTSSSPLKQQTFSFF